MVYSIVKDFESCTVINTDTNTSFTPSSIITFESMNNIIVYVSKCMVSANV